MSLWRFWLGGPLQNTKNILINCFDLARLRLAGHRFRSIIAVVCFIMTLQPIDAHDGHAPLPTKGAIVQGNQLMLSDTARQSIGIESAKVTLADLEKTVQAQCQIRLPWHQQTQVSTLLPGRIMKVLARPGDKVEKDQILAEIVSLEFETIQRDLLKAVSASKLTDRLLAQRELLAKTNAIPSDLLTETRRQTEESAAELEVANRKLLALGLSQAAINELIATELPVKSLLIRSPIKGEVATTDAKAGQIVAPNEHLFHIVELSELEFAGEVIESDIPAIRIGQSVQARFASIPGQDFSGVIEHSALEVDKFSHSLTVIAHATNPEKRLKPGMTGRMTIVVAKADQAIVCPTSAISGTSANPYVFLERSANRYDRREVKLGIRHGKHVEILDGLFPGDRVVVVGAGVLDSLMPPLASTKEKGRKVGISPRAEKSVPAKTSTVSTQLPGLVALGEVEVPIDRRHFATSQVEGRISRILVHPGEDVQQGQILAEVASLPVFELQLELLQNQAKARWKRELANRLRSLGSTQAVKKIDLWQAETDLDVLEHQISEIRSQLSALGIDESAIASLEASGLAPGRRDLVGMMVIPIRAPVSGRLDHFDLVPGQVVRAKVEGQADNQGQAFEIHDRKKVWVRAYVRESDSGRISLGQGATLSFSALPDVTVSGKVVRISPIFDPDSRVLPIWIEAENTSGQLFENMQAKVTLEAAKAVQ